MTSSGSCIEKTVSTEPLILRPPVGNEVYGQPKVWFRSPFSNGPNQGGRRRSFYHCLLSTLLALIAVIMVLVILFILGVSPFSSDHRPLYGSQLSQQSVCRVFIPVLKLQMTELISADDNMFNVTVFGGALTGIHTLRILHLCKDGLTVIRTNERCYIRPMGRDWRRVCSNGYMRNLQYLIFMTAHPIMSLLQNGRGLQTSVEARLTDELWFMEQPIPETIRNSHISAWCEGVPAFRLLSNQPSEGFSIDPLIMPDVPVEPAPSPVNLAANDDDDDDTTEVLETMRQGSSSLAIGDGSDPDALEPGEISDDSSTVVRVPRHTNATKFHGEVDRQNVQPKRCHLIASVLEGGPLDSKTGQTLVIRDKIFSCTS
ncbi:uncharacterized protein DEA37_0003191 [Paragonimus westermani]|uniref:Uncharacterized protein n=1 Tax=Paragonimus westermani TaxID=34504 RepID=A0A5J4NSP3_9TREM|nr:uncharacterized protein DEA37_0003191 [Paragonimus westermani]